MVAALSEATWEKVRALFPPTQHDEVAAILQNQCGNNLPFLGKETPEGLERFRFAALKLSRGRINKLADAVRLANKVICSWPLASLILWTHTRIGNPFDSLLECNGDVTSFDKVD